MSVILDEYLRLEQQMLRLETLQDGDAEADEIRDFMDEVWRRLSPSQRKLLNDRAVVAPVARPRLSVQVSMIEFISSVLAATARKPAHAQQVTVTENEIWAQYE